jgi:hypothetical protein
MDEVDNNQQECTSADNSASLSLAPYPQIYKPDREDIAHFPQLSNTRQGIATRDNPHG